MLQNILHRLNSTITGGAITIAFFSIISKIVGLLRDRLLASQFGAGDILDIYYAAFRLPDMVFNTLILGALSAAFIPVFVKHWSKNKNEALAIANSVLNILLAAIIVLAIICIIAAPVIVPVLVPGFNTEKLLAAIWLTRIMFISIIFFTFSNILSGLLNSFKSFFAFSLAPIVYNFGIIMGIVWLYPWLGISGLAWGVVIGSILHAAIQFWPAVKNGWKYSFTYNWRLPGVQRIFKLMIPRTFALGVNQINYAIMMTIASTLTAGSVTVFNLANNLQSLNIVGISIAISCFPVFSETLSQGDTKQFTHIFSINIRRILYIIIPTTLLVVLLREHIVRIILGAGSFDWDATVATSTTLAAFIISLFAQSITPVLVRAFYALEDTRTPVVMSVLSVTVNIVSAWYLSDHYGVSGLALGFSLAAIIQCTLLGIWLKFRLKTIDEKAIIISAFKMFGLSLVAFVAAHATLAFTEQWFDIWTFVGISLQTCVALVVAAVVYITGSILFDFSEVEFIKRIIKRYATFLRYSKTQPD